jgi:cytochrome P450
MLAIVAAVLVVILTLLWTRRAPTNVLPGPPCLPFLGSILHFLKNFPRLQDYIIEQGNKYDGKVWGITGPDLGFATSRFIFISKPDHVQHILKDQFDKYEKGKAFYDIFTDFLGEGIFVADGAKWKFHRKVASHMFSKNLLKEGTKIALKNGRLLVKSLKQSSQSGASVDLQDLFFCLTMDVFSEIAFGVELHSINAEGKHPFAVAFDSVQQLTTDRMENFFWWVERAVARNIAGFLCPREQQIKTDVTAMRAFSDKVINEKRRTVESGGKLGQDLISRFMENKDSALNKDGAEVTDELKNKELQDIVRVLIVHMAYNPLQPLTTPVCYYMLYAGSQFHDRRA